VRLIQQIRSYECLRAFGTCHPESSIRVSGSESY